MKTFITASNKVKNFLLLKKAIEKTNLNIDEVVIGTELHIDKISTAYCKIKDIKYKNFIPNFTLYGLAAKYRNIVSICKNSEQVLIVGELDESLIDVIRTAKEYNLPIYNYNNLTLSVL